MKYVALTAGMLVALAAGSAFAANATIADSVHMYAGPNTNYPEVMRLSAGRPVTVHGCLANMEWCDVEWRGNRGWVPGGVISPTDKSNVGTSSNVLSFDLKAYWEQNYQTRPWYADKDTWYTAIGTSHDIQPETTLRQEASAQ